MANMLSNTLEGTNHIDVRPSEVFKSEKMVKETQEAVKSFLNPFTVVNNDKVNILSSGAAATVDVENDVLGAEQAAKDANNLFITTRLETSRDFFEPVKHLSLKTLGYMNKKVNVTTTMNRVVQYKQQGNVVFQLFMKSQNQGLQLHLRELNEVSTDSSSIQHWDGR